MQDFSLFHLGDDNPSIKQHQAIVSVEVVPHLPILMDLGCSKIMCPWEALLYQTY